MTKSHMIRFATLAVLASACARQPATSPRPDAAPIRSALSAQLTSFAKAIAAKDHEGIANMFTADGTWILPDASNLRGRTNIEAAAKNYFTNIESFIISETIIDKLVVISDSEALTFSHANYTLTEKGKAPTKRVNPVADYWTRGTDGSWRIAYEINADGPVSTATATAR